MLAPSRSLALLVVDQSLLPTACAVQQPKLDRTRLAAEKHEGDLILRTVWPSGTCEPPVNSLPLPPLSGAVLPISQRNVYCYYIHVPSCPTPPPSGASPHALVQTDWIEPSQWKAIEPKHACKDLPDLVVGLGMHLASMLGIAKSVGRSSWAG